MSYGDANELLKQDEREERAVRAMRGYRCFGKVPGFPGWIELDPLMYWQARADARADGFSALIRMPRAFVDRYCGVGAEV